MQRVFFLLFYCTIMSYIVFLQNCSSVQIKQWICSGTGGASSDLHQHNKDVYPDSEKVPTPCERKKTNTAGTTGHRAFLSRLKKGTETRINRWFTVNASERIKKPSSGWMRKRHTMKWHRSLKRDFEVNVVQISGCAAAAAAVLPQPVQLSAAEPATSWAQHRKPYFTSV